MTERMSDARLDREIRDFLRWSVEALDDGPGAAQMAVRVRARVAPSSTGLLASRRMWILLAGLLLLAVAGVAAGSALVKSDGGTGYEAVILRFGEALSRDLFVFGIDARGRERSIATLGDARLQAGPPVGLISTSGLLAIPRPIASDPFSIHWEIVDLLDPTASPIVIDAIMQDTDQLARTPYYVADPRPGPSWGPNEQLALPWYVRGSGGNEWSWTFVDGRTGTTTTTRLEGEDLLVLPGWAADGSGVLVGRWCDDTGCDVYDPELTGILRSDGDVIEGPVQVALGTSSRRYRADGGFLTISRSGGQVLRDGTSTHLAPDGEVTDVAWTTAGDGVWLVVRPTRGERDLRVERADPSSEPRITARVEEADAGAADPVGSRIQGHIIGLAPDDSLLAISTDRLTGDESNGSQHPVGTVALVSPATGEAHVVEGSFAGWLEVER